VRRRESSDHRWHAPAPARLRGSDLDRRLSGRERRSRTGHRRRAGSRQRARIALGTAHRLNVVGRQKVEGTAKPTAIDTVTGAGEDLGVGHELRGRQADDEDGRVVGGTLPVGQRAAMELRAMTRERTRRVPTSTGSSSRMCTALPLPRQCFGSYYLFARAAAEETTSGSGPGRGPQYSLARKRLNLSWMGWACRCARLKGKGVGLEST
jgi:hypothetical protein